MDVEDAFRIRANASSAADRSRVLKDGELFAIFDQFGDIQSVGVGSQGIYLGGTRHLSRLALLVSGNPPLLLSSTVRPDNALMTADLTNPDLEGARGDSLAGDTLHIRRDKLLLEDTCWEKVRAHNYGSTPLEVEITLLYDCDYADVFEVRGTERASRGKRLRPQVDAGEVIHAYRGLDGAVRRTRISFQPTPDALDGEGARFTVALGPGEQWLLNVTVTCEQAELARRSSPPASFEEAVSRVTTKRDTARSRGSKVTTNNTLFNEWLSRSLEDLHMLTTETPHGPYPYAGIPWFSTPFGRDGIITAFQCLWWDPELARGVLNYLSRHQGRQEDAARDAQPGKILHERRYGEMAALGEIPFGLYYGSVDSTPLFVWLAGAYVERSGDLETAHRLWPAVERALTWIERHGDLDGDGYVEYSRRSAKGLVNQGWKDSGDAVFHADGIDAEPPIALCEVQGYVYAAWLSAARLVEQLGEPEHARELTRRAEELRQRFDADFWDEALGTYVLALDGTKRPCRVRSSNAGQCLWTGIVKEERAPRLVETLLGQSGYSGWGVRTLSTSEARYNPLAYHNGSIWPHDNALVACGLSRYGYKEAAVRILEDLFAAACFFEWHRLPEVFCGFPRQRDEGPTRYPVACAPQAWSCGTVYLLLQAILGLSVNAAEQTIAFERPRMPGCLAHIELCRLRCGEAEVDLVLTRHREGVGVEVTRRDGNVRIIAVK